MQVSELSGVVAFTGGDYHSLALKSDGTVWAWGYNGDGQLGDGTTTVEVPRYRLVVLATLSPFQAGYEHSLALKSDGTVWARVTMCLVNWVTGRLFEQEENSCTGKWPERCCCPFGEVLSQPGPEV